MKILVDVRLLSKGRTSGIEEYTRLLLDHFLKIDNENKYQLFYNGFSKAPLPEAWLKDPKVSLVDWPVPNKIFDVSERFLFWPKVDSLLDSDLVFSPHFNILRTKPATKRVITFHDLSFLHHPEFFPPRKMFWHWVQDYARQAREATRIIAVSKHTKEDLVEILKIDPAKIEVVYSGVDPHYRMLPKDDPGLGEFAGGKGLTGRFLLYVGTLEPRKNLPNVIEAFNIIKERKAYGDLKLVVVGVKGWLYEEIFKSIESSPFRQDIVYWGKATREELLYLYNLASIFVYPSYFEGFGFPPLEAQACGLPVVTSSNSSLKELFSDSAVLVDPRITEEIADSIGNILSNEYLRDELITKGLRNSSRFNWSRAAVELLTLFKTIGQ